MLLTKFLLRLSTLSFCILLLFCNKAYAYVDPGTGSYILQIVIAGFISAAFMLKLFWRRIQLFISNSILRKNSRGKDDPSGEDG
jgi:hypothetical protein